MKEFKDIRDDQIRIIGEEENKSTLPRKLWFIAASVFVVLLVVGVMFFVVSREEEQTELPEPALFEPVREAEPTPHKLLGHQPDSLAVGYTEIRDTLINDIPIKIFIPHNAEMSLHIGRMDKSDKSIIYAAQAADV